ncbi:hypothetical protein [Chishuiella sp.]|uniref:hypothetical protein n=1 Tax=Chishuiella sp. TaxID=1969467 RepID=UPI0028AE17B6|nr:hypothetical protein [Chishuiella sp.]
MPIENKTHDTYVLGLNQKREITFFKTYDYPKEQAEAQKDLKYVQENHSTWEIGDLKNKIQNLLNVQKKWDDLDNEISKCYPECFDDDENEECYENADLCTIGELAAQTFGYL